MEASQPLPAEEPRPAPLRDLVLYFLKWIAAGFVFARRFAALGQSGWAAFSAITSVLFLAAFVGTASGAAPVMALVVTVTLVWAWISATSARLMTEVSAT